ncbi:LOW QUALITY PROTEIN: tenascin-X-like [Eudromia elegans]
MWPGLVLALVALMGTRGDEGPPWTPPGPAAPAGSPGHPCGAAALEDLLNRLRVLEGQVRALRSQCGAEGWPQAVTGRTDARRLCSGRGTFEAGRCACACAPGWGGPTCAERLCARACAGGAPCERGRCRCPPGRLGAACDAHECPQGRGGPGCRLVIPVKPPVIPVQPLVILVQPPVIPVKPPVIPVQPLVILVILVQPPVLPEIPSVTLRVVARGHTSFQVAWSQPREPVDSYQVAIVPMDEAEAVTMHDLPGVAGTFEATGLVPGGTYEVSVQARREQHPGAPSTLRLRTRTWHRGDTAGTVMGMGTGVGDGGWDEDVDGDVDGDRVSPPGPPAPAASPAAPSLQTVLQDLGAKLAPYNGTLQQRLESYLRATAFPLRGNQTVPAVARAIVTYLLRRSPAELRERVLHRLRQGPPGSPSHVKPHVTPGVTSEILVSLDGLRDHVDTVVIRYRLVGGPEGAGGELQVPGDVALARIPGLVPGATYHVEVHGVVQGRTSKSYSTQVTTGESDQRHRPCPIHDFGADYDRAQHTPHGVLSIAAPAPPVEEEPPSRPRLGDLTASHVTPTSVQLDWTVLEGSFDSFTVQYKDTQGQPQAMAVDGGSRTVTVPDLVPSRRYKFNLYGVWGRKRIGLISTEAVTAPSPPREEPSSRPQLGDLTASDVTPTSVQLQWMVPEGSFDSFTVQYKDAQGQPQVVPVDRESRTVTVPNLVPSRRYKFNVYGVWGRKRLGPISTDAVTEEEEEEPPPQPQLGDLTASQVTPNSIQLDWTVPEGSFDSFMVQYKDAQGQPQVVPVDGESRTVTVPNLVPSRRYKFNLYGVWGRKRLGPVSTDAITATAMEKEKTPSQPQLDELTASHVTPTSVQLHWTVPEGSFDSFTVQYKDTQGQSQTLVVDRESRTVTVSNLEPSQHYKFNLYGVWGRKRLGPISTDAITGEDPPKEEPPSQPQLGDLTASQVTPNSIQLDWTVPEGTFDSFTVQYKDAQGQPQVIPVDGESRTVTMPDLVPSRRYKFNLYGVWGQKRLGPVSTDAVTAPAPPEEKEEEPPSQPLLGDLTASHVTPNSIQLDWTVPEGSFDSFTVQYKDAQGQPQVVPVDGESRTVTVPNLVPSRRYKFNLYGVWGRKRLGPISTDAVTASPEEEEPPSQPQLGDLTASQVTPNSIQLDWTVPEGSFDSFTVQYKDAQGQPQVVPVDGESRTVTVPNLVPSRCYKFNLYGMWKRKRLGPISTDAVTAPAPPEKEEPPSQPQLGDLTASHVTPNSIQLDWTVPEGSFDSFMVQYKDAQGQPQVVHVDGESHTVTVPNLVPSRRYKFNVYGMWGRKRLGPVSTDAITGEQEKKPPSRPQLGDLTASDVTPNSIQLDWTVPEGNFDSFTVQYKDAQGQPQVVPVDGESRTVTVPNLVPSRRYKFNVYGMWGRKRLGPISTDAVTAPTPPEVENEEEEKEEEPPSPPQLGDLTASHVTPNSIQLDWTIPEGSFDSFTVQYEDAQGQPQVVPVDGESRTVILPNLVPSQRYKFNLYGMWKRKHLGPVSVDAVTAPPEEEEDPPWHPQLGDLTASHVTPNSIQLDWTVPEGSFDSFTVQYKDAQGQPQVIPVDGESRTVTVPNLVPSRRYKFNVYGVWGRKRLGPISTDAVTAPAPPEEEEPPSPPQLGDLTASHVTPNSIQLDWTVPEGNFDSFTVQYKDAQGQPQVVPVDGESRTVTVPNLVPSRRYKFNLYGMWKRKRLGPISADAVTEEQEEDPPWHPQLGDLTASHVTPNSIQLEWTVPEGSFDSFTVQYKDAQGQLQVIPVDGESRTVTVPNLVPSRRYKFNVYGMWGRKRLGPISTDAVTAPAPLDEKPPSRPRLGDLTASHVTPSSIQLDWTVPEGNFDSFIVQYKDAQGQPQVVPVDGGSRTVTVPNLVPSRRYKFNLYGVWGRKRLGPTSTDAVTAPAPSAMEASTPPQLGDLTAPHVTPTSVQLQWTVPEGSFDSFTVQYKDAQGQPQVVPVDGESRTVTVPNLVPSRRYKFNVYGLWGRKRLGPISTDAVTAPSQEEPPSQPQLGDLTASHVTPNSIQLDWTVPEGTFDSFTVQYKDAQGQPQVVPVDGESRTVTVSNLVPSQRYKFNLYGLWGRKRLGPISTDAVTAPSQEEPPSPPQLGDLTASHVTPNSIQLDWTVPEGSFDSFTVQYKDAQGQPQVVPVDRESRTVTVSNLVPSRRYKFNVYGMWGRKRLGPISTDAVTGEGIEEPPFEPHLGNLTSSHVTSTSIQLNWTILEGTFDSFVVQYEDGQGQPQELPVDGVSRTVTVSNLTPSHVYKFNVYGVWGQKRLGPISTNAVTDPSSPRGLRVEEVTPRSARLRWDPPSAPPSGYVLTYGTPNGDSQTHELPPETVTHKLGELEPSGRYRVQLRVPGGGTPLEATIDTPPLPFPHPRDCAEEQQNEAEPSREALVFLGGDPARPLRVYCDMESDGGGWLVFQRRVDGGTDFWRNWDDYARGFGNVSGEFWLGNEALHELTRGGRWELRVELRAPGEAAFARYRDFAVGGAADDFRLHLGAYSGTAGDALGYHVGSPFSTRDRARPPRPCALSYTGAWWYRNCHLANLNGRYGETRGHQGIHWFPWKGFNVSIPFTEMKLRPQRD